MKLLAFWRYHLRIFANPFELNLMQKYWLNYKRPDEAGFYSEQDRLSDNTQNLNGAI
jgi:hypothetical protein